MLTANFRVSFSSPFENSLLSITLVTLAHFSHFSHFLPCGYVLRQSPGQDVHRFFDHLLEDLAGRLYLRDEARDLARKGTHVIHLAGPEEALYEGRGKQDLGRKWKRIKPGVVPEIVETIVARP